MGRQAFIVTLMLAVVTASASAQWIATPESSPGDQQAPVYLKSLTSSREKAREASEGADIEILVGDAINRVGRAFETGDADRLEACVVTGKRKIYLSLETDDGKQGHYGPGQVRHIFGRLFREVETRKFIYDARDVELYSGAAVFRADWTYVVVGTDELVTKRLQFKLEQDDTDWRIYEIRAATR